MNVKLAWTINVGQTSVVVLDIFNSIMPGILSILLVFGMVRLIKKGYKPITLVFTASLSFPSCWHSSESFIGSICDGKIT